MKICYLIDSRGSNAEKTPSSKDLENAKSPANQAEESHINSKLKKLY